MRVPLPSWSWSGFHWAGLHRARWVLAANDGLDEYGESFASWFLGAIDQVDHFHLAEHIWWISGSDYRSWKRTRTSSSSDG